MRTTLFLYQRSRRLNYLYGLAVCRCAFACGVFIFFILLTSRVSADEGFIIRESLDILGASPEIIAGPLLQNENTLLLSNDTFDHAVSTLHEHIGKIMNDNPSVTAWVLTDGAFGEIINNPEDWRACLYKNNWYQALGDNYIKIAAEIIREFDPGAVIYLSDTNIHYPLKRRAYGYMLAELNADALLIDGVSVKSNFLLEVDRKYLEETVLFFADSGVRVGLSVAVPDKMHRFIDSERIFAVRVAQVFGVADEYSEYIDYIAADNDFFANSNHLSRMMADYTGFLATERVDISSHRNFTVAQFEAPTLSLFIIDPLWERSRMIAVNNFITIMGEDGSVGTARVLWTGEFLYVYVQVRDNTLDATNYDPYFQDAVTVTLNEISANNSFEGCSSYTVNYKNEQTFALNASRASFLSIAEQTADGYAVQMQIPFKYVYTHNSQIGLDIYITDTHSGALNSIAAWNALRDYPLDPYFWGTLILQDNRDRVITEPWSEFTGVTHHGANIQMRVYTVIAVFVMSVFTCLMIYTTTRKRKER